jgi:hypothetical protein
VWVTVGKRKNLSITFIFRAKSDSGRRCTRIGKLSWLHEQDRFHSRLTLFSSCHIYHCLSLDYYWVLIFELTVTHLNDKMVNTHDRRGDPEPAMSNGKPPTPPTLAQAIASILESRDDQTELLWWLVVNSTRGGNWARNNSASTPTTYGDFAATHLPLWMEASNTLEVDHWLWTIESRFGLLCCMEN